MSARLVSACRGPAEGGIPTSVVNGTPFALASRIIGSASDALRCTICVLSFRNRSLSLITISIANVSKLGGLECKNVEYFSGCAAGLITAEGWTDAGEGRNGSLAWP